METRRDTQPRQTPLHLRSRSMPRSQLNGTVVTTTNSKPDVKIRGRARSVSKDRSVVSSRTNNEPDGYVILSDALSKIQIHNPLRFKKNLPSKQTIGSLNPLRATVPTGSDVEYRLRNGTNKSESSTANGTVNGTPGNVWKPVNSIERKTPALPKSFNVTQVQKKEVIPSQPTESKNGAALQKTPKSRRKTLCVIEVEQTGERVLRDRNVVTGVGFVPKRESTQPKPFSFDKREKKIETEIRGHPQSQANHLPASVAPRERSPSPFSASRERSPSPFSREPIVPVSNGISGNHADNKTKDATVPSVKASLASTFRARIPVVLAKKPFEPVKPQRQLPLPSVTLATEERARKRQEFDKKQAEREEEIKAIIKRQKEEQERREREATLKLRKELVHKAKPIPHIKHFEPHRSDRPLTDPESPLCLKRSAKTSR